MYDVLTYSSQGQIYAICLPDGTVSRERSGAAHALSDTSLVQLGKKGSCVLSEVIGCELFDELARTGGITLSPEEAEDLREEMNRQMQIIRQLEAIPLDDRICPVIHGNPFPAEVRCGLREDEWIPFPDPRAIPGQAPVSRDGYFVSPDVPHQKIG